MNEQELILSIMAIVMGTSLTAFIFARITKLIRIWLEGKQGNSGVVEHQKQFRLFKMEVERRLATLEAIVTDDEKPLLKSRDIEVSHEEEIRQLSNLLKNKS